MTEDELFYVKDQFGAEFGRSTVRGDSFTMEHTTVNNRSTVVLDYGMGSFAQEYKVRPVRCPPPSAAARRRPPPAVQQLTYQQHAIRLSVCHPTHVRRTSTAPPCAACLQVP